MPQEVHDYYETLQVHPKADDEAIRAAYRRLCELYDPARLNGVAEELIALAQSKRQAIEQAYATLSDPVQRAAYDAAQRAPRQPDPNIVPAGEQPAPQTESADVLDYRPLPPARQGERPRGFDVHPTAQTVATAPTAPPANIPLAAIILLALALIAVAVSVMLTGGAGLIRAEPTVQPTLSPLDQFDLVIADAQRLTEQNPDDVNAWIDYGNKVYDSVQVVREQAPDSELYRQRLPRWLEAIEAYDRALALDPTNASVLADKGVSACFYGAGAGDQGFVRQGLVDIRNAAISAPNDPLIQFNLGNCLVIVQPPETAEAIQSWQRVIELVSPESPLALQAQMLIEQYRQ